MNPKAPAWTYWIFYLVVGLLFLPLLVMVVSSLRMDGEWSFHWYRELFLDENLEQALLRSLIVALFSALGACGLGLVGALSVYKYRTWLSPWLEKMTLVSLVLPELVFALSLLSWFALFQTPLSLVTVIVAHITFCFSFAFFIFTSRLVQLDKNLEEAAMDLGASEWQALFRVVLPLLKPATLGALIVGFLMSFDDFLVSYFVNGVGSDTLPINLYTSMKMGISPKVSALASLLLLAPLSLLTFSTKFRTFFK